MPANILSPRVILYSFSKLWSIRTELWLSKQTLYYGGLSDCAEVGVPGELYLSQAASRAAAITTGTHTHPEEQGQGLLPSLTFNYTDDQTELCSQHPWRWWTFLFFVPTSGTETVPCPGEIAEITLQALAEPVYCRERILQEDRITTEMCKLLYLISLLKLSTRKRPPSFFSSITNKLHDTFNPENQLYIYLSLIMSVALEVSNGSNT